MCSQILLYILLQLNGGASLNQEAMTITNNNSQYTMSIYTLSGDLVPAYSKQLTSLEVSQEIDGYRRINKMSIGNDNITVGNTICNDDLYSEASHKLDKCFVGLKLGLVKEMRIDNTTASFTCTH